MELNAGSLKPIRATLARAGRLYLIFMAPGAAYFVGETESKFRDEHIEQVAAGEAVSTPL